MIDAACNHLPSSQIVGLPAKQSLFRNASNTITKCKELLDVTSPEESDLPDLQKTSTCPVVLKNGKLFYEVEVDEKTKQVPTTDALSHIYQKLYGNYQLDMINLISTAFN